MTDALHYEWTRIRTLRSTYWLIAWALFLNAAVAFSVSLGARNDPLDNEIIGVVLTGGGANLPAPIVPALMAFMGILATGHEYRYGTIQPTLSTVPQRTTLLSAKLVVVGITALVVAVVSMLANLAAGLVFWHEIPDLTEQPLNEAVPAFPVLVLLWAVLGTALGQLFRGVTVPLGVILVGPLVVEQLIFRLSYVSALDWLVPVAKYLPFLAGQQLVQLSGEAAGTDATEFNLFDRWVSGGVFATFVAITLVVAWTLFKRRDA
jgi:ABC-type transport system involved in multi-copper enzyme maturation permease subunit